MAKYGVELPIAGYIYLEVEADNKEDAIEKALLTQWQDEDIMELDSYKRLASGNVMHVSHSDAGAYPIK